MPTKHDTSSLSGQDLNQAVAIAAGMKWRFMDASAATAPGVLWLQTWHSYPPEGYWGLFNPARNWDEAGPLIEAENIMLSPPTSPVHRNGGPNAGNGISGIWGATTWHRGANGRRAIEHHETSPLIAAMRCYVASKLGDTVELP